MNAKDNYTTNSIGKNEDTVNHPSHYTSSGEIECIDAIDACISTYKVPVHAGLVWQVVKYLWRAPLKGHYEEDIHKAKWYLDRLVMKLDGNKAV